jgi:hypothetical protein
VSLKIHYNNVPREAQHSIERLLRLHKGILPLWVARLNISFNGHGKESYSASTRVDQPYRYSTIYIYGDWLEGADEVREHDIVHELFHVTNSPAFDYAFREIRRALPEGSHRDAILDELRDKVEACVEDMTNSYLASKSKRL